MYLHLFWNHALQFMWSIPYILIFLKALQHKRMTSAIVKPDSHSACIAAIKQASKSARLFLNCGPSSAPHPLTTRRMTVKNLAAHRPEPHSGNWNCINRSLSWGPLWCASCRIYLHVSSMFAAINTAERWILARCAAIHHCHHRPWIYENTLEGWSLSRGWSNNAASTVIGSVKWVLTKLDEFAV